MSEGGGASYLSLNTDGARTSVWGRLDGLLDAAYGSVWSDGRTVR